MPVLDYRLKSIVVKLNVWQQCSVDVFIAVVTQAVKIHASCSLSLMVTPNRRQLEVPKLR